MQRTLGPLTYMLATHEASIGFGDAGHTVTRTDSLAPAGDAKVARAKESAEFRGWQNLEYLLEYLENNVQRFPEWESSLYRTAPRPKFFRSATDFQYRGMIDIGLSRLTYEKLTELIRRTELSEVRDLITAEVYNSLADPFSDALPERERELIDALRPYIAARVASLHTSAATREQRFGSLTPEYRPVIRPLFDDLSETGNYYIRQLGYWRAKILEALRAFGVDSSGKVAWNGEGKNLFMDIG